MFNFDNNNLRILISFFIKLHVIDVHVFFLEYLSYDNFFPISSFFVIL